MIICFFFFFVNHSIKLLFYQRHAICMFYFLFLIKEKFNIFYLWIIHCLACEQNVSAGINTLMSFSDGLGTFIFFRKTEETRPMREAMDRKVVYFPPELAF